MFAPVGELSSRICNELDEAGRLARQAEHRENRAKTRFLGFKFPEVPESEASVEQEAWDSGVSGGALPLGRLVIVDGAGRGQSFDLSSDVTRIGRGDGQEVQLAFGDNSVSRYSHATIVHYGERGGFVVRDGRKANPVLLNGRPLNGEKELCNGDHLRVGETTLRFLKSGDAERL